MREDEEQDTGHGGEPVTTNNRMEMMAVIEGLRHLKEVAPDEPVTIISDSQYVVKGVNEWRHKWKAKGWKKKGGRGGWKEIKNLDLWRELDALTLPHHDFLWVQGHAGVKFNELADHRALEGANAHA